MLESLLQTSYFALFLIIALGFILGRIKIKGLSLDISAVIFIALLFGHFGVTIPKELGNIGLVLFIFTIGIQAGPGFFDSFRSKGKTLIILALLIVGSASLAGVICKYAFGLDTASIVGLIAGALTSTPGLAVAIDTTQSASASIAYGIAYPFGVIGVILFVKLLPKILRIDLQAEAKRLEEERKGRFPELQRATFRVENEKVLYKTLAQLQIRNMTGAVVSRIKHNDEISMPRANTVLHEGDLIRVVGNKNSIEQVKLLIGEQVNGDILIQQADATVDFIADEKLFVWADEFKTEQVMRNYLTNAIHHVENERRIEVRIVSVDGKARVTVFNSGKPIPEEDLPKLWDKFYKVDKAHTREYGGNGIGLSIVKAIMESFHQKYGVRNFDNGVAFWFELDAKMENTSLH